jgi:uncharacterized membrane protein
MLRELIVLLSLGGLADALYFTFAYYGRVKRSRWVPQILCAREGSSCVTVVQTPYARVFGVPNSLLGIIYYVLLIVWGLGSPWPDFWFVGWNRSLVDFSFFDFLILASIITIGLGFYLIYALRRKLHVDCPLCYTAHAINAALLVLLVLLAR